MFCGFGGVISYRLLDTDDLPEGAAKARDKIDAFFGPDNVSALARLLIQHYLPLRQREISLWQSDPEAFVSEEDAESWEYNLRPCAENVLLTLSNRFRGTVGTVILELMRSTRDELHAESNLAGFLLKEAAYSAACICAYDLFDVMDFRSWFHSQLLPESQVARPGFFLLHRRIAALMGRWASVKMDKEIRPDVYALLARYLGPEQDLVVRISAAQALRSVVDDFDFEAASFEPFLPSFVSLLARLIGELDELDTKSVALSAVNVVLDRMRSKIRPFARDLVMLVPSLWSSSGAQHLFKASVLAVLTKLVDVCAE